MLLRLFITILCSFPLAAFAQAKKFSFRNISIEQGLSQSSVVDIMIDQTGFIWMATQDGLNRYDGHSFTKFSLNFDDITTPVSNQLGKIVAGTDHQLWLVTRGGRLQKMDLLTELITPFPRIKDEQIPPVSCVLQDSSLLFIGTIRDGLWIYEHNKNTLFKLTTANQPDIGSNEIKKIFKDSKGKYWILTNDGAALLSSSLTIENRFFISDGNKHISLSSITEDASGKIWIGTFGYGVFIKKQPVQTLFN